jgi:hypothetical protein
MIASFHVVTFRRRQLAPRGGRPDRAGGLRSWSSLFTARDPFVGMPAAVSRARLLQPNLREWAFFGVWERESDVDAFLARSPLARAWAARSTEVWTIWLRPARARGSWAAIADLRAHGEADLPRSPAAFLTRLDLPFRALPAMWLSAVPGIAPRVASAPGLVTGIPLMDRPYLDPMTFSVWRSLDDAMAFAYRAPLHGEAVGRLRRARGDVRSRFSSVWFHPVRSCGTWKGADPLAGASTAAPGTLAALQEARSASSAAALASATSSSRPETSRRPAAPSTAA